MNNNSIPVTGCSPTKQPDPELLGAIARGWCHDKNRHKVMDGDLALAIAVEVAPLLNRSYIEGRNVALDNAAMKAYDMGHPDVREEINHLVYPPRGPVDAV
jgi:hypothetical protein